MKNTIKDYLLNNMELTIDLVNDLNSWNGCLDFLNVYDMDSFDSFMEGEKPTWIAERIFYGSFNPNSSYFRFDSYGNLESMDYFELEEEYRGYIDEIIDALLYNHDDICIYDNELKEIIEAYEENN